MKRSLLLVTLALLLAVAADARPLIVRSVYRAHFDAIGAESRQVSAVATALDSMHANAADVFVYVHIGYWEPVIAELERRGKRTVRYLDGGFVRTTVGGMRRESFERIRYDTFVRTGRVLKDATGAPLFYAHYGQPFVCRWDQLTSEDVDDMIARLAFVSGGVWELDQWFTKLRPWMLVRGGEFTQDQLDALYDPVAYRMRADEFRDKLAANAHGPTSRRVFLNGSWQTWYARGQFVMLENATRREWDEKLAAWRAMPGSVLEIRQQSASDPVESWGLLWSRAREAIEAWLEDGRDRDSWLWIDNESVEPTATLYYARDRRRQLYGE